MPVTVPMPQGFDIGPALSAHAAGLQQRRQGEEIERQEEERMQQGIAAMAYQADTPEKWAQLIPMLQEAFPEADLSRMQDFSARDYAIGRGMDPYQLAQLDLSRQELALRQSAEARAAAAANAPED